jgi:hypothetical protein
VTGCYIISLSWQAYTVTWYPPFYEENDRLLDVTEQDILLIRCLLGVGAKGRYLGLIPEEGARAPNSPEFAWRNCKLKKSSGEKSYISSPSFIRFESKSQMMLTKSNINRMWYHINHVRFECVHVYSARPSRALIRVNLTVFHDTQMIALLVRTSGWSLQPFSELCGGVFIRS